MGMFDELENQRVAREAKMRAELEKQARANAAAHKQSEHAAANAEAAFAALDKMVVTVLQELHGAVYPECEVRTDQEQLRWLVGIQPPHGTRRPEPFEPVIIVAPLFNATGATARLQCESTYADAFRERRSRGRVERTADLSPAALGEALIRLHRR